MNGRLAIVRDFRGQPLQRVVVDVGQRLVWVANPMMLDRIQSGVSSAVGFPINDVYRFEKAIFLDMEEEWKQNECTNKWADLKPFTA